MREFLYFNDDLEKYLETAAANQDPTINPIGCPNLVVLPEDIKITSGKGMTIPKDTFVCRVIAHQPKRIKELSDLACGIEGNATLEEIMSSHYNFEGTCKTGAIKVVLKMLVVGQISR